MAHTVTASLQQLTNKKWLKFFSLVIVRQLEADILTISRGNSILVLSCFFKVSKYISGCWPR